MPGPDANFPKSRQHGLLIEQVGDETIVYDDDRKEAHALNRAAAIVWRHSDGTSSVKQLASTLTTELGTETPESVVEYALDELSRAHLLEGAAYDDVAVVSRREVVRRIGFVGAAAIALPVVLTIAAPTPAMAASGRNQNGQGQNNNNQ